jgi:TonB family protein
LSPAQIQRVVYSRMGAFRACYEAAASRDPKLKGTVTVSWRITPGGAVTGAVIGGSSLGNARVEGCVLRQVKRLRFPAADKGTSASFPFAFRPAKN